jgi:two-component system chemotaxis response regulator CheY
LLSSILESMGAGKVITAEHGGHGFAQFLRFKPDIVITDWVMEPVDGITLIHNIRTHPSSTNRMVPIIIITGYSSASRVKQARDMGVTEFLVKPFTGNDLAKRIAHIINKPRDFVQTSKYFGPDRRRKKGEDYQGPKKRGSEKSRKQKDPWEITIQ